MEYVKKIFYPGTYEISQSGIYTYINTSNTSYMIPDGSDETIIIKDGKCKVVIPMEKHLQSMGFGIIYSITETDEDTYTVLCNELRINEYTPKILKASWSMFPDENGEAQYCALVVIKL